MKTKKININGMTKIQVLKLIYSKDEIKNIDCSLPLECYNKDHFFHVMNFNKNVFGLLQDIRNIAKNKNIKLIY
tara:strand:- start:429 stop:650 length:222 start_codon:yes stop_codon:yes gene_type:complete